MKKITAFLLSLALLAGLCIPAMAAGTTFSDVPSGQWYTPYVERAAGAGWVNGIGGGRYSPSAKVTYGQFCTMITQALYPADVAAESAGAQWWQKYVSVAARHGLLSMTHMDEAGAWSIYAGRDIPREEMAIVLYNAVRDAGATMPSQAQLDAARAKITDYSSVGRWGRDAVAACYAMGLLSGYSDGRFGPSDTMTRAQAATVLCSVYDAVHGASPEVNPPDVPSDLPPQIELIDGGKRIAFRPRVHNEVQGNPQGKDKFTFTIEPAENYPGVVMPSDNNAYIYGTGDATFEPIQFTEAGTYSFVISEEVGMENYRYDAREWTVTVTVTGAAGAPEGTLGGQYDVTKYSVPADVNKDGYLTEAEVRAVLDQLMEEYPKGSPWGEDKFYNSPVMGSGTACAAFAKMASDRIFGDLPKRVQRDAYAIRLGDVISNSVPHWCIVRDFDRLEEYPEYAEYGTIFTHDGNVGGEVWTGSVSFGEADSDIKAGRTTVYTRYPAGEAPTGDMTVSAPVYTCSNGKTGTTASFISTCLDAPTWSDETVAKAQAIMADMSLEEKVGQLFLLHYPGDGSGTVAQAKALIEKYHPGGYLVFAAMFEKGTPDSVRQKIADTQAASDIPLLITVDEEGGIAASGNRVVRVSKYSQYGHDPFRSPQELKAAGGLAAVAADAVDKANFLKDLGLNVNHAPVADVSVPGGMMYGRTWGGSALENAEYVETLVEASEGARMPTTMKHFPGYGATSSDTHNGFAYNDLSWDDFIYNDLLPFHAGIAAGGRAVMVTHNTIGC